MRNKNIELESERLILRPLSKIHLSNEYVSWLNDYDVNRFLETGGNYTKNKLQSFLQKIESLEILFWAIHLKKDSSHIGNIKIDPIDLKHKYGEYGILIGDKTQWGKGFAKEATLKVIDYCFSKEVDLRKINLGVNSKNVSAINLYQNIGFITEGILKKHIITGYGYDDVIRMAIFNSNYEYDNISVNAK